MTPNTNKWSSAYMQRNISDSFIHSFLFYFMNSLKGLADLSDIALVTIHYTVYWYINLIYTYGLNIKHCGTPFPHNEGLLLIKTGWYLSLI